MEKVINREKAVHEAKKKRAEEGREATKEESEEEKAEKKERQGFKKMLREKLLQFITRIPVFMYLTDYREQMLIDVIRNLEPELFTKVTGLTIHEFDLMCEEMSPLFSFPDRPCANLSMVMDIACFSPFK